MSEASDPQTAAIRLDELSKSGDRDIQRAIASNPNASLETLFFVAQRFTREVLQNPAFQLFLLEDPDLLRKANTETLKAFLQDESLPSSVIEGLARSSTAVNTLIAKHPNTPPHLLESLYQEALSLENEETICAVAQNPKIWFTTIEMMLTMDCFYQHPEKVYRSLTLNPKTPTYLLERLLEPCQKKKIVEIVNHPELSLALIERLYHSTPEMKEAVFLSQRAPLTLLERYWHDKEGCAPLEQLACKINADQSPQRVSALFVELTRHHNTPLEILEELSNQEDSEIRCLIIDNQPTTEQLIRFARDPREDVRLQVALHPKTPPSILWELSQDPEPEIRESVAMNKNLPEELFDSFLQRGDRYRSIIELHPKIPSSLLRSLLAANAERLLFNRSLPPEVLEEIPTAAGDRALRAKIAEHPNATPKMLARFYEELDPSDDEQRAAISRNPNTPLAILRQLSLDNDLHRTYELTQNPSTPDEIALKILSLSCANERLASRVVHNHRATAQILDQLAKRRELRMEIAQHPNTSGDTLVEMATDTGQETITLFAKHPNAVYRNDLIEMVTNAVHKLTALIAKHPNAPEDLLRTLAQHNETSVVIAVAQNKALSASLLEALANHEDHKIRAAALQNPRAPASLLVSRLDDTCLLVLQAIAKHPNTPPDVLLRLSQSVSVGVRGAVASNPTATTQLLAAMFAKEKERLEQAALNKKSAH